jgi:hypothetical protein
MNNDHQHFHRAYDGPENLGMTLRDYFAARAMQSVVIRPLDHCAG